MGAGMSPNTGEERSPSLDTLTWCHFEELVHLLGLCFDHWQLSHLSRGLRKRQVSSISCPQGCHHHVIHPTSLHEAGGLSSTIGKVTGHSPEGAETSSCAWRSHVRSKRRAWRPSSIVQALSSEKEGFLWPPRPVPSSRGRLTLC